MSDSVKPRRRPVRAAERTSSGPARTDGPSQKAADIVDPSPQTSASAVLSPSEPPAPVPDDVPLNDTPMDALRVDDAPVEDGPPIDVSRVDVVPADAASGCEVQPAAEAVGEPAADPVPSAAPRFLAALYEALNPDIAVAVARGHVDAEAHWWDCGSAEERAGHRPSLNHPHHLAPARAARRDPGGVPEAAMDRFDPAGYGFLNADLRPLINQDSQFGVQHFLRAGITEERPAPGWRPNAGRGASVAGLLSRPCGVDLYAPFGYFGPIGRLARRLAFALAGSGQPFTLHAYDQGGPHPRVPHVERGRPGSHRVSLILCEPMLLQALVDNYPFDHFADSYVIALWPGEWRRMLRQVSPVESALDEVWVGGAAQQAALSGHLRAPVHRLRLPVGQVGSDAARLAARAELGLPPQARCVLFSLDDLAPPWSDRPMLDAARAQLGRVIEAFRHATGLGDALLLVQAPREPVAAEIAAMLEELDDERIVVLAGPDMLQADRQVQDAADILLCGDGGLAAELRAGAFLASARPVLAAAGALAPPGVVDVAAETLPLTFGSPWARRLDMPVFEPAALSAALVGAITGPVAAVAEIDPLGEEADFAADLAGRIAALGLDTPPLPFARYLGAGSALGQAPIFEKLRPRSRDRIERLRERPFFDVLLVAGGHDLPVRIGRSLSALAEQSYPLLRIHLVTATDTIDPASLPVPAGVVLPRAGLDIAQALREAASACAGSHVVVLEAGAVPKPWALTEFAIGADSHPQTTFYADSDSIGEGSAPTPRSHRAGQPVSLNSALDLGPMLCMPRAVFATLPVPCGVGLDAVFAFAAALMARARPIEALDEVLSSVPDLAPADHTQLRAELIAELASVAGARLLTDPRSGVTRLAPPVESLPPVTLVVTAAEESELPAALALLRRLADTAYPDLRLALVADHALEGRIDAAAAGLASLSVFFGDGRGGAVALRQRGLIGATTPLVGFVDPGADGAGPEVAGPDWLAELAEPALSPGFGAAGVAVAAGGPTPAGTTDVTAVDGACLLVDRIVGLEAGGFAPAFGRSADVALCLALRAQDMRVVVVPGAGTVRPAGDIAALLVELEAEWGALVPEDFARRQRPLRRRVPAHAGGHASADPRPAASAPPEPVASAVPPSPAETPRRAGGWRRSV